MPTLVDDITGALQSAARAGAATASSAGRDLRQDVETFVVPQLKDIASQVASIVQKRNEGIFTDITAKDLLDAQADAVRALIETVTTLAALEAQKIRDAIVSALAGAVNAAVGFALLA